MRSEGYITEEYSSPDGVIELPEVECSLRLADLYDDVQFVPEEVAE